MCDDRRHGDGCDCYDCVEAARGRRGGRGRDFGPRDGGSRNDDECCAGPDGGGADFVEMWKDAFREAYREVQLEILKAKIKATLGKTMEKAAAAVIESMMADIKEGRRRGQAEKELKDRFEKILKDAGAI